MKKKPMTKIVVPVGFMGMVEVEVPASVPEERREALAGKIALARLLATTENPDAPEEDACGEYEEESGIDEATANREWDGCMAAGVSGQWWLQTTDAAHAAVEAKLVDKAESAGLQPEDLDDLVHDLASGVASDVNNGGLEDQAAYLIDRLGVEEAERQIAELIEGQPRKGE
jgi:hypothetical protein